MYPRMLQTKTDQANNNETENGGSHPISGGCRRFFVFSDVICCARPSSQVDRRTQTYALKQMLKVPVSVINAEPDMSVQKQSQDTAGGFILSCSDMFQMRGNQQRPVYALSCGEFIQAPIPPFVVLGRLSRRSSPLAPVRITENYFIFFRSNPPSVSSVK